MDYFFAILGMFISVMLIGIILLQRGRGGGLVGALSGLGGQSAFGTKAGDTFTRITIGIAAAWVLLAGIHGQVLRARADSKSRNATSEADARLKEKESGATSKESGATSNKLGVKEDFKFGTPSDLGDDGAKIEGDLKTKSKSDESTKELIPDDDKKSDSAPKSKEPPKKELDESTDPKSDDKSGEKK